MDRTPTVDSRINLLGALRCAAGTVRAWRQRACERHQIASMDARLRRDIGLSRVDIWHEANKPFRRD
jgi:uncharacterized protein YjiS (DUF1127 family)